MNDLTWALAGDIGLRLGVAAAIGTLLALHPLRVIRQRKCGEFDLDTVRAQILIAVAGALMVVVVGDSVARAFGLVGIGSFVRFRTSIRNPRDTACLFLLIGLGMASGLQLYSMALLGSIFTFILLGLLEIGGPSRPKPRDPLADREDGLF
jgi:uncharacterized membrane protein YhiD involved in acid resistance